MVIDSLLSVEHFDASLVEAMVDESSIPSERQNVQTLLN